jgi:hypothetical protein
MRYRDYIQDFLSDYRVFWEMPDIGTDYPFIVVQGNVDLSNIVWSGQMDLNLWHNEDPTDTIYDLMKKQNIRLTYPEGWIHGSIRGVGDTIQVEEDVTNTLLRLKIKGV